MDKSCDNCAHQRCLNEFRIYHHSQPCAYCRMDGLERWVSAGVLIVVNEKESYDN